MRLEREVGSQIAQIQASAGPGKGDWLSEKLAELRSSGKGIKLTLEVEPDAIDVTAESATSGGSKASARAC